MGTDAEKRETGASLSVRLEPVEASASRHRELESSPHPNVPYSLALFLASPKKKGEKEGRLPAEHGSAQAGRSARPFWSRLFTAMKSTD